MKCQKCDFDYGPTDIVQPLVTPQGQMMVCPICALAFINQAHGQNRTNFTKGSVAQALLERARKLKGI